MLLRMLLRGKTRLFATASDSARAAFRHCSRPPARRKHNHEIRVLPRMHRQGQHARGRPRHEVAGRRARHRARGAGRRGLLRLLRDQGGQPRLHFMLNARILAMAAGAIWRSSRSATPARPTRCRPAGACRRSQGHALSLLEKLKQAGVSYDATPRVRHFAAHPGRRDRHRRVAPHDHPSARRAEGCALRVLPFVSRPWAPPGSRRSSTSWYRRGRNGGAGATRQRLLRLSHPDGERGAGRPHLGQVPRALRRCAGRLHRDHQPAVPHRAGHLPVPGGERRRRASTFRCCTSSSCWRWRSAHRRRRSGWTATWFRPIAWCARWKRAAADARVGER